MAINVKDKLVTLESLGVAYSAEQDAREEADQALSTRIDNIVAPEGDPSLTEVSDARVSGSTTYNTLKARLDADKAAIGTEISQLSADLETQAKVIGQPYETLTPVEYTLTNGKKFKNTAVGSTLTFQENTTYHYIQLEVEEGEKYRIKTYFSSADTYYIYMCDSNVKVVSRSKNANGMSGSQTFDVTIPSGVAYLYIQGYSSASAIVGRMSVDVCSLITHRDKIDSIDLAIETIQPELQDSQNMITYHDKNTSWLGISTEKMTIQGSVSSSDAHIHTRIIALYNPTKIKLDLEGWKFAINQFRAYNYSSSQLVRNWLSYKSTPYEIALYADTYPMYVMVGAAKTDESTLNSADIADFVDAIRFESLHSVLFASIAMFNEFAVTGCSWDAGSAYGTYHGHVSHTGIGWAETLGRRNGCQVGNFAIGVSNIRSWFNTENHASSFRSLLLADAYPLYILTEGNSNDANAFVVNDSSYSAETPSATTYYVGTIEDISTREDYHDYPCTFYGYYGRVIEMIQEHAPGTRIIISSPDTTAITTDIRKALRTACKNIATYYGLPYMNIEKDPYYDIYVNAIVSGHPTAPTYSGWAMAIERLFSQCVEDNLDYFRLYSGRLITGVEVEWEAVSLE